jgi:hypothetical protein
MILPDDATPKLDGIFAKDNHPNAARPGIRQVPSIQIIDIDDTFVVGHGRFRHLQAKFATGWPAFSGELYKSETDLSVNCGPDDRNGRIYNFLHHHHELG